MKFTRRRGEGCFLTVLHIVLDKSWGVESLERNALLFQLLDVVVFVYGPCHPTRNGIACLSTPKTLKLGLSHFSDPSLVPFRAPRQRQRLSATPTSLNAGADFLT